VDGVVALLSEDVRLTMPPLPMEYHGRRSAAKFQAAMFRTGRVFRLVATRANGQPAFGVYLRDPLTGVFHATGLLVLTLAGDRICAMTRFDNSVLVPFGLPRTLPPARNS
jgi:RNA polymerase sigma-70 factor (ECF subfamily)